MLTEKVTDVASKYTCLICDYNTQRKSSYDKHLSTAIHCKLTNDNQSCKQVANDINLCCQKCNKEYKSRVGLWKHKKNCNTTNSQHPIVDKDLIMMLIKKNDDLQTVMMEQQKSIMEHQNKNVELQTMIMEVIKNIEEKMKSKVFLKVENGHL